MTYPLRELRKQRQLTLQAVADVLTEQGLYENTATSHVARLEERGTFDYRILKALEGLYGVSCDDLASLSHATKNLYKKSQNSLHSL
jgi:transcriptional regulator with XRE-family HTH domain